MSLGSRSPDEPRAFIVDVARSIFRRETQAPFERDLGRTTCDRERQLPVVRAGHAAGRSRTLGSRSCTEAQPSSAKVRSIPSRRISRTRRTPAVPPAARPQTQARPHKTARAPNAKALTTSAPVRTPPSSRISTSVPTVWTMVGNAAERTGHPVEHEAAVVRNDDGIRADIDGPTARRRPHYAFDDERALPCLGDPRNVVPSWRDRNCLSERESPRGR